MYGRDLLRYLGRKNRSIDLCFCWDSNNDDEEDDDGCQSNRLLNENAATTNEDMTLMENVVMKAKQRAHLSRRLCLIRFDDDGATDKASSTSTCSSTATCTSS